MSDKNPHTIKPEVEEAQSELYNAIASSTKGTPDDNPDTQAVFDGVTAVLGYFLYELRRIANALEGINMGVNDANLREHNRG